MDMSKVRLCCVLLSAVEMGEARLNCVVNCVSGACWIVLCCQLLELVRSDCIMLSAVEVGEVRLFCVFSYGSG